MSGNGKDVALIIKRLQSPEFGCTVTITRKGHLKVVRPGHRAIVVSHSPSDHRALNNIKRDIRNHLGITI